MIDEQGQMDLDLGNYGNFDLDLGKSLEQGVPSSGYLMFLGTSSQRTVR